MVKTIQLFKEENLPPEVSLRYIGKHVYGKNKTSGSGSHSK